MRLNKLTVLVFFVCQSLSAQNTEYLVDASGERSPHTTIDQAINLASPGDKILVMPGRYPSFQFNKGVNLIGLGTSPNDVVIDSIAYHISLPATGYDSMISNVSLESTDPLQVLVLSGNELPPGVLVLDTVNIRGGVFLRGGQQGFYLLAYNCNVTPPAGNGFSGEACYLGGPGNYIEFHSSRIEGWNADAITSPKAGIGLRLGAGTTARINSSRISGGNSIGLGPVDGQGAAGIEGDGLGAVSLRLDGETTIRGGDGNLNGGFGVNIQGSIVYSDALVAGGYGILEELSFGTSQPTYDSTRLSLGVTPTRVDCEYSRAAIPGDPIGFKMKTPPSESAIILSTDLNLPANNLFLAVDAQNISDIYFTNSISGSIPDIPGFDRTGFMLYAQGVWVDPVTNQLRSTGTASIRINF